MPVLLHTGHKGPCAIALALRAVALGHKSPKFLIGQTFTGKILIGTKNTGKFIVKINRTKFNGKILA